MLYLINPSDTETHLKKKYLYKTAITAMINLFTTNFPDLGVTEIYQILFRRITYLVVMY